jgi:hypothetical protein
VGHGEFIVCRRSHEAGVVAQLLRDLGDLAGRVVGREHVLLRGRVRPREAMEVLPESE